jgi:predicted MFS family arabinose efflux permease
LPILDLIRSDLSPSIREPQPVWDLMLEGMRYTFRERRLRALFILEVAVSMFGLVYIALLPTFASDVLHFSKTQFGFCYTFVGAGAICGLLMATSLSGRPIKGYIVKCAAVCVGIALISLSFARTPVTAYVALTALGFSTIAQFNTTNSLFQLLSPDYLRGRVLSMHIWALAGLGSFGTLLLGKVASHTSIPFTFRLGAAIVLLFGAWGWTVKKLE